MMKKLILSVLILASIVPSAQAFPGWKQTQIESWLKTHTFLSPLGERGDAGFTFGYILHRQIKNGKRLVLMYRGSPQEDDKNPRFDKITIFVEDNSESYDWQDGLWERENNAAYFLLEKAYGTKIAEDFKNSKFVFTSPDYSQDHTEGVFRSRIGKVPDYVDAIWSSGTTRLYLGQHWGYQIDEKASNLHMMSIENLNELIDTMEHNTKIYKEYKKWLDRTKPADLDI